MKKKIAILLAGILLISCTACGTSSTGNSGNTANTENSQETETESKVEIADATDILTKVWGLYEDSDTDANRYNDKFSIMGGHYDSAVLDMPAKYDLTQTSDLTTVYCVPESVIEVIDDAATMVHFMKATSLTAGAYHITDAGNMEMISKAFYAQISGNHWLDGFPDAILIVQVDEAYIIAAVGDAEVIEYFETALNEIYGKQVNVLAKESVR